MKWIAGVGPPAPHVVAAAVFSEQFHMHLWRTQAHEKVVLLPFVLVGVGIGIGIGIGL